MATNKHPDAKDQNELPEFAEAKDGLLTEQDPNPLYRDEDEDDDDDSK